MFNSFISVCPHCWKRFFSLKKFWELFEWDKVKYNTFLKNIKSGQFPQEAIIAKKKHGGYYKATPQKNMQYSKTESEEEEIFF